MLSLHSRTPGACASPSCSPSSSSTSCSPRQRLYALWSVVAVLAASLPKSVDAAPAIDSRHSKTRSDQGREARLVAISRRARSGFSGAGNGRGENEGREDDARGRNGFDNDDRNNNGSKTEKESEDEGDDRGRGRGSNGRKFGNSGKGPTSAKSTPVSLASANGFVITLEDAHNSSMSADPVSTTKPFNTMTATPALDGDTDAAATPKPTVVVMSAFAVCLLLGSLFGFFYRWQRYRYRLKAQMAAREYAEGKTNMSVRYYQTYVLPNKPGNDRVRKVGGHDVKPSKSTAESGFRILGSGFSLGLLAKNTNDDNHDSGSVVHGLSSSEPSHSWPPMNEERLASSVNLARSDPAPTTNTRKPALTIRTSPAKWTGWLRTPTSPTPKSAGSPDSSISGVLFGNRSPLKRSNSNHSSKSNRSDNSKVSATTSTTSAAIDAKASTTPNSSASTIINDTDAATETKCYIRPEEAMIYTPSPSAVYILGETPVGSGIDDGSYLTMVGHQHVGTLTLGSVMEDPFGLLEADHPAQTFATPAIPPPVMISNHQHSPKDKEIPQQNDGTALGVPGGKENGRVDSWQSIQTTSTELTDASEQSTVPFSTF